MHEMAMAQDIFEIVQRSVPKEQAAAVRLVKIRVGKLAGVVPDSLEFCFSAIISDTDLQEARLLIENIPTAGMCRDCSSKFPVEEYILACPACRSNNVDLISGNELEITEIELVD
jgi:hydrogenase nickel incorporation protein HypA/HybF